jgi:hypothetical protein
VGQVFTFPGCTLPPADVRPSDIAEYCRRLADLIDSGTVPVAAAVFVLSTGPSVHVQAIGADAFRTMGLLGFAQRMIQ